MASSNAAPAGAPSREGLRSLVVTASASLPVTRLGIVAPLDAAHAAVTVADKFGLSAHRAPLADIREAFRPRTAGLQRVVAADLDDRPNGIIEGRFQLAGFPEETRSTFAARQVFALPIPDTTPPRLLLVGVSEAEPYASEKLAKLDALAREAATLLFRAEEPAEERERLRRLDAADALLPALFGALDIRDIFDRVSALTKSFLAHDAMALGVFNEDVSMVAVYAHTSTDRFPKFISNPYAVTVSRGWLHHIVDDHLAHPIERSHEATRQGVRSSLNFGIWLGDRLVAGLRFLSREPDRFSNADIAIGRRVADFVALAMSHQRLAEESRRAEEVRARAATHELLEQVLEGIADTGGLRAVFARVSAIAKKVVPHDAITLAAELPGGRRVRVYASSGIEVPEIVEVPEGVLDKIGIETEIVDDLHAHPTQRELPSAKLGFRSVLRVAIRVAGKLDTALQFLSYAPSVYKEGDLLLARRIADRLTLSLSRVRRAEALQQADQATERAARLEARVQALTDELNSRAGYRRVIGESPTWRHALTQATQVAPTESTVLLLGESGTGKEVVARFVHGGSPRTKGPFIALNCAALPENLLEAELFGYERGAFTGAMQSKPGQLEMAAGGTLFLDEVGEMSLPAQAKFLRVLQEREFQRLGGTRILKTDARVVAATNRDLGKAIERGQFREDLYYRLNVFSIQLPPLRDRKDDVLPLSEAFIEELGKTLGRPPAGISKEARQALLDYHWPGNVRELRNVLERAAILADGGLIAAEHFALRTITGTPMARPAVAAEAPSPPPPAGEDLKATERAMIEKVLQDTQFNKSLAAKRLGISRAQLYVRLRKYGLE